MPKQRCAEFLQTARVVSQKYVDEGINSIRKVLLEKGERRAGRHCASA